MKKLWWIILVVVIVLIVVGYFGISDSCSTSCGNCKLMLFKIPLFNTGFKKCPMPDNQIIGGCAGVSLEYRQECCDNWAKENDIAHIMCVGRWTIENNQCEWSCGID